MLMLKMSIPNQPRIFPFPKRTFGKKKPEQRSFQSGWFDTFKWLHYDEVCIIEITCLRINKQNFDLNMTKY